MTGLMNPVQAPARRGSRLRRSLPNLVWAAVLGVASGLSCAGVRLSFRALQWLLVGHAGHLPAAAAALSPRHRLLVPVLGAVLATAVLWANRWSKGEPFEEYVEAVRFNGGRIPFGATAWRTVSSAFSVATGAAIGREGSMIQFAAAVTSVIGGLRSSTGFPLATQVACGAAAAVAAAYQAPVAGVLFAYEIVLGDWNWSGLPMLATASLGGWLASRSILGGGPLFTEHRALPLAGVVWMIPLALVLAALGPMYQRLLRSLAFLRKGPAPLVLAGLVVGALGVLRPAVWGNGDVALSQVLSDGPTAAILGVLALRLVATSVCVGAGTVGGVFTPTLFTGAALGLAAARLVHAPEPVLLAVGGLSVLLAAVTHAPWMAGLMAVELTGQWHLLPLLLPLTLGASYLASRISSQSLYGIATADPAGTALPAKRALRPRSGLSANRQATDSHREQLPAA